MSEISSPPPQEADLITDLACESKAYWGYDNDFIAMYRDAELTVHEQDIEDDKVRVVRVEGEMAGFYKLEGEGPRGELAMLFIHPNYIGTGLGRALYDAAKEHARALGWEEFWYDSDPHAEEFYVHLGAQKIGEIPSKHIPGRMLPRFLQRLTE